MWYAFGGARGGFGMYVQDSIGQAELNDAHHVVLERNALRDASAPESVMGTTFHSRPPVTPTATRSTSGFVRYTCDGHLPQPRLLFDSLHGQHSTPRLGSKGTGVGCLQRTAQNCCLFHRRVLQGVQWCVSVRLVPECVLNGWLLLRPSASFDHYGVFRGLYALQERGGW